MDGSDKVRVIITGSTGMVGKGVLLECLENDNVSRVLVINRSTIGLNHPKLEELLIEDFSGLNNFQNSLEGYNACFFCSGVSSVGVSEERYTNVTYDLTINMAKLLVKLNPQSTFCYVSGVGTDSSEKGNTMWARVKGKTENTILAIGFKAAFMFRPGYIQPLKGVKSKTGWYNVLYVIFKPLYPMLRLLFPNQVTSTIKMGEAMINAALYGYKKPILESKDINALAKLTQV